MKLPPAPLPSQLRAILLAVAVALFAPAAADAQNAPRPARPRITGISHVALWVAHLGRSRSFYDGFLGFAEPYVLSGRDGSVDIAWVKINDRQTIELFPLKGKEPPGGDSLYHVALETDDAQGMLAYLASTGVKGPGGKPLPTAVVPGRIGNLGYFAEDPDRHIIEFTQYLPSGWTIENRGRFMPGTRIAPRISHAGITVGNLEASLRFYRDILGFREFWRGSSDGKTLSWANLRAPDGDDYIELMLYRKKPVGDQLHVLNHLCLEVASVADAQATLKSRTPPEGCVPATAIHTGVNGKRQINCFDPDTTRIEIMEARTVDGLPATPSDAPPPNG